MGGPGSGRPEPAPRNSDGTYASSGGGCAILALSVMVIVFSVLVTIAL